MRLTRVVITGYRSIKQSTTLHVEPDVTVILGPNDHGKTNCLSALLHLNQDRPFDADTDLNWDSAEGATGLPAVEAYFALTPKEVEQILASENPQIEAHNKKLEDELASWRQLSETSDPAGLPPEPKGEPYELLTPAHFAKEVVVRRVGVKGELEFEYPVQLYEENEKLVKSWIPRFELFVPTPKLSDSVTSAELAEGQNEFMRGIFYYAGLDPDDCASLFDQTDRTMRALERASETLDTTLRESWSQGRSLRFKLRHDSKHQRIELLIDDPAVNSRFVRASRRSSGFTHYFALKTMLHARQRDHAANAYFLMFDEPGTYLHPSGQYDLLQVLETLALENQLAYVTHSLFMINKTFPIRHRLLMKGDIGTTINGKPYTGRWSGVLSSLGMTVTGTILFSNHVVLTEGDSDPIYLYAMLQKGVAAGKCHIDLNSLAFMPTGESKHAEVMLRLLLETSPRPKIGLLTDGDQGGKDRLVYVQALTKNEEIPDKQLTKDTSVEDHIPNLREVFVPAVADYTAKLMTLQGANKPDEQEFRAKFLANFDESFEKNRVTTKVLEWAFKAAKELGGLTQPPSKVGIAREYALGLTALPNEQFRWEDRQKALVEWLMKRVGVPEIRPLSKAILQ